MLPRLSTIEYAVLDILRSGREMYGLEMVNASNGSIKRGTVYVTLGRMEEKKLIKSRAEENPTHAGMPRRQYKISGQGQAALSAVEHYQAQMSGVMANGV